MTGPIPEITIKQLVSDTPTYVGIYVGYRMEQVKMTGTCLGGQDEQIERPSHQSHLPLLLADTPTYPLTPQRAAPCCKTVDGVAAPSAPWVNSAETWEELGEVEEEPRRHSERLS